MFKILVVEDDRSLNQVVCGYLGARGFDMTGCMSAQTALDRMDEGHFDMIISDIMMPGMYGFEFAKTVRAADKQIPILFMTAREDIESKQRGYDIGIDEYIVKPFDLDELVMRVNAILRRANIEADKKLTVGNLVMDSDEHTAYVDGRDIALTVREFDILFKLLSDPKKTFTRSQLMEDAWDGDCVGSRTVDVYSVKLREKTSACTGFEIVTVHGLGYKAVLK